MDKTRMEGTITRVIKTRGFAFVVGEDQVERFVHVDELREPERWEEMRQGVRVSFVPVRTKKGDRASEVEFL